MQPPVPSACAGWNDARGRGASHQIRAFPAEPHAVIITGAMDSRNNPGKNGDAHHDIVVIGASAGGVQALMEIAAGIPAKLDAAIFVAIHTSPTSPGILPQILSRAGPL